MTPHAAPVAAFSFAFAIGLTGPATAHADPRDTSRAILRAQGCQTDLPSAPAAREQTLPRTRAPAVPDLPPLVPAASAMLGIVMMAIALAFVVALVVRRLVPGGAATHAVPPIPAASAAHPGPSVDPDTLARAGRFAEAIHALLLRALAELSRRPGSVAASPAATSREILLHRSVPPDVRTALEPIVRSVERIHFGRMPAAADDFAACAGHYARFEQAWRGSR